MFLSLRTGSTSPLQTLVLGADCSPSAITPNNIDRVHLAVDRLVTLSRELADLDVLLRRLHISGSMPTKNFVEEITSTASVARSRDGRYRRAGVHVSPDPTTTLVECRARRGDPRDERRWQHREDLVEHTLRDARRAPCRSLRHTSRALHRSAVPGTLGAAKVRR